MQDKELYLSPECYVVPIRTEGIICESPGSNGNEGVGWGGGY